MAYKAITCPQCGAPITSIPSNDTFFCSYCGAKIEREKVLIEVSGRVSVSGIANEKTLFERAYLFLEDGKFDEANTYFERVLDLNPQLSKAYLGKLLAVNHFRNTDELIEQCAQPIDDNSLFQKALRFANKDEHDELMRISDAIIKSHDDSVHQLQQIISESKKNLEAVENDYVSKEFTGLKYSHRRAIIVLLLIIVSLILIISVALGIDLKEGFFVNLILFLFFIAPCIAAIIGLLIWSKRIKKRKEELDKLGEERERLNSLISLNQTKIREIEELWNG